MQQPDNQRIAKQAVSHCETACLIVQNGLFWNAKRPVLQCKDGPSFNY